MNGVPVVLFDLDGTLVDSEPGILASFEKAFEPYGVVLSKEQQRSLLGPPLKESFARFLAPNQVDTAVNRYRAFYRGRNSSVLCISRRDRDAVVFKKQRLCVRRGNL